MKLTKVLFQRQTPGAASIALLAFVIVLLLDQVSKWWVVEGLGLRSVGAIDVLPPLINFRMAWNDGVNFGLFGGNPEVTRIPLVVLSTLFALGALLMARSTSNRLQAAAFGVAAGGALGNAIDRLVWGAVADFLNMSCCGINNPYAFNVADVAIFAGLGGVILLAGQRSDQRGSRSLDDEPTGEKS